MNAQEVDVYLALPQGLYRYDPQHHGLQRTVEKDVRRATGYQDFVDDAPLDLIFVANHARMKLVPASQREAYASVAAGAMAQNIALYCASAGLVGVVRMSKFCCRRRWGTLGPVLRWQQKIERCALGPPARGDQFGSRARR